MINNRMRSKWPKQSSSTGRTALDYKKHKPFTMKFPHEGRRNDLSSLHDGKDRCRAFNKDQYPRNKKFYKNNQRDERKRKASNDNGKILMVKQPRGNCTDLAYKTLQRRVSNKTKAKDDHRTIADKSNSNEKKIAFDQNEKHNEIVDNHRVIHAKRIAPPLPLLLPLTTMLVTPARAGLLPTPRFGSGIISCLPNPNKVHQAQALTSNMIANNATALRALKEPPLLTNLAGKRKQPYHSNSSNNPTAIINLQSSTASQKIRTTDANTVTAGKPAISLPLPAPTTNTVLIPGSTASLLPTDNASSVALVTTVASIISTGTVPLLTSASSMNTTPTAIPLLANATIVQTQANIPILTNPIGIAATQAAVALASTTSDILPLHTINGQEKPKPKVDPPAAVLEKAAQLQDKLRATQAITALRLSSQLQNINSLASASLGP